MKPFFGLLILFGLLLTTGCDSGVPPVGVTDVGATVTAGIRQVYTSLTATAEAIPAERPTELPAEPPTKTAMPAPADTAVPLPTETSKAPPEDGILKVGDSGEVDGVKVTLNSVRRDKQGMISQVKGRNI